MAKLRDYNMNGTIILGVDAGYGNYKTARCCFPTSVSRSSQPPVFTRDYLEYEGSYYTIGEGHKDFVAEKSLDDDNYILTLACIEQKSKTVPTIELRGEKDTLYVYEDEIMYAEKEGNFAHVSLTEGRQIDILSTMRNLYTQVADFDHFFPISEQVFINISFVEKLTLLKLTMRDGHSFTVSPLELSLVRKALEAYRSGL